MADDFMVAVDRLLDEHDRRRNAAAAQLEQAQAAQTAFLDEFARIRREVLRPAIESLADALRARGHEATIVEEEFSQPLDGKTVEARISIRLVPASANGAVPSTEQCPSLAFLTRHYNRTIEIVGGNLLPQSTGATGTRGAHQLNQITPTLVREKLLGLVEEFSKK